MVRRSKRTRGQTTRVAAAAQPEPINLMSLPLEVIERILCHVDEASLRNLRLTSKSTKQWVEGDPNILSRLPIRVTSRTSLIRISKSKVNWNHFIMDLAWSQQQRWHINYNLPSDFPHRLRRFLPFIRRIQLVRSGNCKDLLNLMCELGPQVNSFSLLGYVDGALGTLSQFEQVDVQTELRNFLRQLKEFEMKAESNLTLLRFVWENLSNVKRVQVPITMMKQFTAPAAGTPGLEFFCAEPLLTLLNGIETNRRRSEMIRIEFYKEWFSNQLSFNSTMPHSDVWVILQLCQSKGIRLYNVPVQFLPTRQGIQNFTQPQQLCLTESIGSILLKNVTTGFRNYYVPPDCPVSISIDTAHSHPPPDYSQFELPDFGLNLVFINWNTEHGFPGREFVFDQLFEQNRSTVTKLIYKARSAKTFRNLKLSEITPNLRKIYLSFDEEEEFNILKPLSGLQHLEKIVLDECYLTESSVIKKNGEARLLDVPRLKHLKMWRCSMGHWSNHAFATAFPYLKLTTFLCTNTNRSRSNQVTLDEGLKYLNTIDGGLKDTLETIECFASPDYSDATTKAFLAGFRNLKKSKIHFPGRAAKVVRQDH